MAEIEKSGVIIAEVETKNIMTKSALPVGGYSVNPYVGCTHGCKYCFWLENLNLRGGFKRTIMDYIGEKYPALLPLYREIYDRRDRSYFEELERKAEELAAKYDCPFVDNEMPYGRVPQGHPVIVDYFYHEEVRGSGNTGRRNKKAEVTP